MKTLKFVLWVPAIGCLSAVPFIFLPWSVIESIGSWFGIESLPSMPIAVYFFKVTFGVFGLIGVFFVILARNPPGIQTHVEFGGVWFDTVRFIGFGCRTISWSSSYRVPRRWAVRACSRNCYFVSFIKTQTTIKIAKWHNSKQIRNSSVCLNDKYPPLSGM